jgi:hypothetical protein
MFLAPGDCKPHGSSNFGSVLYLNIRTVTLSGRAVYVQTAVKASVTLLHKLSLYVCPSIYLSISVCA